MTIQHCVLVKFRPEISVDEKATLFAQIALLKGHLPGMLAFSAGTNISPEGLDQGFTDGFVVTFADRVARDTYLLDAEHQRAGAALVAAAEGGLAGLLVFDLAV
jgi:hypothetical protein